MVKELGASRGKRPGGTIPVRHGAGWALAVAGIALGASGACAHSYVDHVRFSPVGRTVAFTRHDVVFMGFTAGLTSVGIGSDAQHVCWAEAARPGRVRSAVLLRQRFRGGRGLPDLIEEIAIAPDSKHIAVPTRSRIFLVSLATGKFRQLDTGEGGICGLAWLSGDQLAYAQAVPNPKDKGTTRLLRVYRQKIHADGKARVVAHAGDGEAGIPAAGWSPDGRYVILYSGLGQSRLLAVQTGKTRNIGPPIATLEGIAWKPDSSAVFCSFRPHARLGKVGMPVGRIMPVLIQPATGKTTPLPSKGDWAAYSFYVSEWTPDGKHLVVNAGWSRCCLVRPQPWLAIQLKDKLIERFKIAADDAAPEVHPLAPAGWLWTRSPDGKSYALDYHARRFVKIAKEGYWAVSPEGKRIAEVNAKGEVKIRPLKLPTTRPAPKPIAEDTE